MKSIQQILEEQFPDGDYTENDVWEAIAESDDYKRDYYADGDLAEWL
jgi:hypothetical protein